MDSGDDDECIRLSGECSAVMMLAVDSEEGEWCVLLAGVAYVGIPFTFSRSDSE